MSSNVVQLRDVVSVRNSVSSEEWEVRVDLAAAYRLAQYYKWADVIYNHISARVPGEPDFFLIKAHELLYEEVTASNLVKVDSRDDEVDERSHVNKAGFTLHGGLMQARPDINAAFHTHIPECIVASNQPGGLLPLAQTSMQFWNNVGYHDYLSITDNLGERAEIVAALGDKHTLMMRNHGPVTVGKSVRDAFILMRDLETSCKLQLKQQAAGDSFAMPLKEVLDNAAKQRKAHNAGRGTADWPAWLRRLDRIDPSYGE
ncbi:MAG: class II aldolase/adducin family protein [Alphaproteobacteria bacterium]|nr:class II aldolase/adducin family protein [Alphaproteobacteria bacterium]